MEIIVDKYVGNYHAIIMQLSCNYHAIINKNGNRRDETNDESNTKNTAELPWIQSFGQK